jgi:hypothetical protein
MQRLHHDPAPRPSPGDDRRIDLLAGALLTALLWAGALATLL